MQKANCVYGSDYVYSYINADREKVFSLPLECEWRKFQALLRVKRRHTHTLARMELKNRIPTNSLNFYRRDKEKYYYKFWSTSALLINGIIWAIMGCLSEKELGKVYT